MILIIKWFVRRKYELGRCQDFLFAGLKCVFKMAALRLAAMGLHSEKSTTAAGQEHCKNFVVISRLSV